MNERIVQYRYSGANCTYRVLSRYASGLARSVVVGCKLLSLILGTQGGAALRSKGLGRTLFQGHFYCNLFAHVQQASIKKFLFVSCAVEWPLPFCSHSNTIQFPFTCCLTLVPFHCVKMIVVFCSVVLKRSFHSVVLKHLFRSILLLNDRFVCCLETIIHCLETIVHCLEMIVLFIVLEGSFILLNDRSVRSLETIVQCVETIVLLC